MVDVTYNPKSFSRGQDERGRPLFMCCLCFSMFYKWQLKEIGDGKYEDVCKQCAKDEKEMMESYG